MAKNKKNRKKAYVPAKHPVRMPFLARTLPVSEDIIRRIRRPNEERLMRFYLGTGTSQDVIGFYTFLCITNELSKKVSEEAEIKPRLERGKEILKAGAAVRSFDKTELDELQDILEVGLAVWSQMSLADIDAIQATMEKDDSFIDIENLFPEAPAERDDEDQKANTETGPAAEEEKK